MEKNKKIVTPPSSHFLFSFFSFFNSKSLGEEDASYFLRHKIYQNKHQMDAWQIINIISKNNHLEWIAYKNRFSDNSADVLN